MKIALSEQQLRDAAVEEGLVPDGYFTEWDDYADWQIAALNSLDLKPHHYLLDIGCGGLRLGLWAISYLESGHYFGVDAVQNYINLGHRILTKSGIDKEYTIFTNSNFDFSLVTHKVDFAIAHSVFTHMSRPQIDRCLGNLKKAMKPGGTLLFTYTVLDRSWGRLYCGFKPMIIGVVDQKAISDLARKNGGEFQRLPLSHPGKQHVGKIIF